MTTVAPQNARNRLLIHGLARVSHEPDDRDGTEGLAYKPVTGTISIATIAQLIRVSTAGRQTSNTASGSPRTFRLLVTTRLPMCEAAMLAKTTETIKSGKASMVARPKSYKAAKAVKTSVVNTRTRNRPGTRTRRSPGQR